MNSISKTLATSVLVFGFNNAALANQPTLDPYEKCINLPRTKDTPDSKWLHDVAACTTKVTNYYKGILQEFSETSKGLTEQLGKVGPLMESYTLTPN